MSLEVWGDDGGADDHFTQERVDEIVAEAVAEALAAQWPSEVWRQVSDRRSQQDARWSGPSHDDHHIPSDWIEFITKQMSQAAGANCAVPPDLAAVRDRLIDAAALAIAAAESLDRKAKDGTCG